MTPASSIESPLIRIEGLTHAYTTEPVLKNVSLEIQPGEFTAVIGPNGSGKTTLLKLMGGILPSAVGSVIFKNNDLHTIKRKELARAVAWIPQEHPMVFPFNVMEVVLMGRHPYQTALTFESNRDYEIARQALAQTQTLDFADRKFNEISGGEKQRVMLASALAQEPEAMILDEPTAALDLKYQIEILTILKNLNEQKGMTVLLAMHDLHLASKFCKRLILLSNGEVAGDGSPQQVLKKELLEKVYDIGIRIVELEGGGGFMISPELT